MCGLILTAHQEEINLNAQYLLAAVGAVEMGKKPTKSPSAPQVSQSRNVRKPETMADNIHELRDVATQQ